MGENKSLVEKNQSISQTFDDLHSDLKTYLELLSLPTEGVLVDVSERKKVVSNLPEVVNRVPRDQIGKSMYISKFVAACGVGLFDAALNFIWNETIDGLRKKIISFDFNYFVQSTVGDTEKRKKIKDHEDLKQIEDWELVKGCMNTGIISEIGYKHLDYIRDMRNHISAAHPNQNTITGLQLVSWLETCILEVLAKNPEESILEIKRLLNNIRKHRYEENDIEPIVAGLGRLPDEVADSVLKTLFGMYSDPNLPSTSRDNINMIVNKYWVQAPEQSKYNIGFYFSTLATNGDIERKNKVYELLANVSGLSYLPETNLASEMQQVVSTLLTTHNGYNNFYTEPPQAKLLSKYIAESGKVPKSVAGPYVKTVVMCKIGNGYGVSSEAEGIYSDLINKFDRNQALLIFYLLGRDVEFSTRLQMSDCRNNFKKLMSQLEDRLKDSTFSDIYGYVFGKDLNALPKLISDSEFKRLLDSNKHEIKL